MERDEHVPDSLDSEKSVIGETPPTALTLETETPSASTTNPVQNTANSCGESIGESQSLLVDMVESESEPTRVEVVNDSEDIFASVEKTVPVESQSLLVDMVESESEPTRVEVINNSEDIFASVEKTPPVGTSDQEMVENTSVEEQGEEAMDQDEENDEMNDNSNSKENAEVEDDDEVEVENDTDDDAQDDQDDEENDENTTTTTQLPIGRIKKIMKICVNTNEEEEDLPHVEDKEKGKRKFSKGKGKGAKNANVGGSTNNMIVTKEAIYLSAVAAELFIAAVTQQSSKITAATKKKTMTVEHLKRALSDSESFEFLQGCFQPSLIIGD